VEEEGGDMGFCDINPDVVVELLDDAHGFAVVLDQLTEVDAGGCIEDAGEKADGVVTAALLGLAGCSGWEN
jgi:hypothetical protein